MGGGGDAPGRRAGGGVAAAPAPGARGSLRLGGVGPRSLPVHPAGLDSSPRNPRTGIHFLGPTAWRPGLAPVSPHWLPDSSRLLPLGLERWGRAALSDLEKREGAASSQDLSAPWYLEAGGWGLAWDVGEGAPGAGPAAQSSFSLGTPTDVSRSAKIGEEKWEPALTSREKGREPGEWGSGETEV